MSYYKSLASVYIAISFDRANNMIAKIGQSANVTKRIRRLGPQTGRSHSLVFSGPQMERSRASYYEGCMIKAARKQGWSHYEGEFIDGDALPTLLKWAKRIPEQKESVEVQQTLPLSVS